MNIDHIVLTSDLSPESLHPFESVADFARGVGAKLTLLHVVQDLKVAPHGAPLAPAQSSPDLASQSKKARKALDEQKQTIGEGLEVEVAVAVGTDVAQTIADYAVEHGADLLALSTHGRTGLRHLVLGSIAEQVIRRSSVPVLSFQRQKVPH